jgi:hypothetical protein
MANRPEIKIYPVVEFYRAPMWEHDMSNRTGHPHNQQQGNRRSPDVDRYLHGLIGKHMTVHTSSAGHIRGVLEAVLSDAIVLRTERGQVLIQDWAVVAIESE